jgi:hypothetical protein
LANTCLCPPDDERFLSIVQTQGREAQDQAILAVNPYQDDNGRTETLLSWYYAEAKRRDDEARRKEQQEDLVSLTDGQHNKKRRTPTVAAR